MSEKHRGTVHPLLSDVRAYQFGFVQENWGRWRESRAGEGATNSRRDWSNNFVKARNLRLFEVWNYRRLGRPVKGLLRLWPREYLIYSLGAASYELRASRTLANSSDAGSERVN